MDFRIRNAINWNRNAIHRAQRAAARAKDEAKKESFEQDITRYQDNIRTLEAA